MQAKNLKLEKDAKAVVIVAHPDDETIWMGGTLLKNKHVDWTCLSLCRASDPDRAPKFKRACKLYGARAIITDLEDEDGLGLESAKKKIKKIILNRLKNKKPQYLFTHGGNGEYGHVKHKAVNKAVTELIKAKKILPQAVFYFNYKKTKAGQRPSMIAKADSDILLPLTARIFKQKKRIQSEVHGYPKDGIDVGLCTNPEAFLIFRN